MGCGRSIQMKLLARPLRDDADRCSRREPPVFRLSPEIHLHLDVPTPMEMHVTVSPELERLYREAYVNRFMLVRSVFDVVRFFQRFHALADEDQELVLVFSKNVNA